MPALQATWRGGEGGGGLGISPSYYEDDPWQLPWQNKKKIERKSVTLIFSDHNNMKPK